jgi:hypothetical protein
MVATASCAGAPHIAWQRGPSDQKCILLYILSQIATKKTETDSQERELVLNALVGRLVWLDESSSD